MTQKKYTDGSGVSEIWTNTKNYIAAQLLGKSDVGHTHSAGDITSGLATVATSGSYNDLSNKPTIPTVNNATLTIQKNGTTVKTFTANASSNVTCNITVPTKTSELTNDSGFLTSHQDLSGYVPRAGGAVITGGALYRTVNTDSLHLGGGTNWNQGGSIILRGKSHPNEAGFVKIQCHSSVGDKSMDLKPDGTAKWDGKVIDTIEEQGAGYIRYSNGLQICWGLGIYNQEQIVSYAKAFSENPSVVASAKGNPVAWNDAHFTMEILSGSSNYVSWQAIGRWK